MAKKKGDKVNNPSLSRPLLAQSSSTSATNSQSDQPISPMPQPYNPNAAHSPTDYSSSHADTLSPSAPPPAYSHHDPATTSSSNQQVQSYHQQPSRPTAQQINNTHPAAVLVPMPVQRPTNIPVDYQPCVDGFAHKVSLQSAVADDCLCCPATNNPLIQDPCASSDPHRLDAVRRAVWHLALPHRSGVHADLARATLHEVWQKI